MLLFGYDEMIVAMCNNDASYDGKFYVGVTSTRIYCLPSCKAKLRNLKMLFFIRCGKRQLPRDCAAAGAAETSTVAGVRSTAWDGYQGR